MGCCLSVFQKKNKTEYESLVESYDRNAKILENELIDDPVVQKILKEDNLQGDDEKISDEEIEKYIKSLN